MGDALPDGFTFFSHRRFVGIVCALCNKRLNELQDARKWVRNQPTPVCAEADNLRLLEARKNDD